MEAHKNLEWFGPPEHNTLRPLCDVLPELVRNLGEELCMSLHVRELVEPRVRVNLCSNGRALPFICPRGARTLSGSTDMWTRRCIINYTLAFNVSDPEILVVGFRA